MTMSLDENALRNLHSVLEEDFAEVVELYLDVSPAVLAKIKHCCDATDFAAAANAAHTLKGSSSNLGLAQMVSLCMRIEDTLRQDGAAALASVEALHQELVAECGRAHQLLKDYCQRENITL